MKVILKCQASTMDCYKFSVLMSVYIKDNPLHLDTAIKSVINQTLLPDQIVVLLDGPLNDELEQVINNFASTYPDFFTIVKLSTNQGLAKALREGLKVCKYELVARMDADDISLPERFEKQINFLKQNPQIDVLGAFYYEFETNENMIIALHQLPANHQEIIEFAKRRNPICHPSVMYKKQKVFDAGNYIHINGFEDYYLWVRMFNSGCKFANIPEVLLYFRGARNVMARRGGLYYAKNEYKFFKRCFESGFLNYYQFLSNVILRFFVRVLPSNIRKLVYMRALRHTPGRKS